jgi:hypothetical protein
MPKQLWYSDSTHEHCIGIRSWRVNEAAAPDLKEFQRPEQRPGWQVVQWRNSGKGFSLFGGWFEPVTD